MKKQLLILTIFFYLTSTSFGQTQGEMNMTSGEAYAAADKELNQVYQSILKEYSHDTIFIKNLIKAQNLWIKLRDADLDAIYIPGRWYGSIEPMCRSGILESFTKDRIQFLKTWSEGMDHQNGCKGTRKTKR